MPKLEDALASLSRVEAPEIWPDVLEREPRPTPPGPSGFRRAGIVLLALAVAVAGFLFVRTTFGTSAARVPATPVGISPKANGDVAYLSGQGAGTVFGITHVVVADPDGSAPREVGREGNLTDVAWAPDGTRIAYVDSAGEFGGGAIYVMNADGSDRHVVLQATPGQHLIGATWSADGRWLAYDSSVGSDDAGWTQYRIMAVPADGGSSVQVSSGPGDDLAPAWSPDGTRIAFVKMTSDPPSAHLDVMGADGTDLRTLAELSQVATTKPAWSPDARELAYLDGSRVMVIGADGTNLHEIYRCTPTCAIGGVSWSPDGSTLSVTQSTGTEATIVLLAPDGSNERELVQGACCVSWQPLAVEGTPTPSTAAAPPAWLVDLAVQMANANGDPNPTSAEWVLTDARSAAPAVGLETGDPTAQVMLVVLYGHFTGYNAKVPPGSTVPEGTVLAFTADPWSRHVTDWGISDSPADVQGLRPFELANPSPSPTALPRANGPVSAVLALFGTSSSIAAGPRGVVYVSVVTDAGPRQVVRWDPSDATIVTSATIPGTEIEFANGTLWAAGTGENVSVPRGGGFTAADLYRTRRPSTCCSRSKCHLFRASWRRRPMVRSGSVSTGS